MFLGICEIYNPKLHGGNNDNMKYQYFIRYDFTIEEFYNNECNDYIELMKNFYYNLVIDNKKMNNIDYKNYNGIVSNNKYYTINIIKETNEYDGQQSCILKTHYISLIQRKWKKIYKERQRIINLRKSPKALFYRELHGKWPFYCAKFI